MIKKKNEINDSINLASFTVESVSEELMRLKNEDNSEYNLYKKDSILTNDFFRAVTSFLFDDNSVKIKDRFTSIYQPISHILLFSREGENYIFYLEIANLLLGLQITTKDSILTFTNSSEDYNNLNLIDGLKIYENKSIITEKNELKYKQIFSNSYYINLSKLLIKKNINYKASFIIDDKIMLLVFSVKDTKEYINVYFEILNIATYKLDQHIILEEINIKKLAIEELELEEEEEEIQTELKTKNLKRRFKKSSTTKNNLYKEMLGNIIRKNNERNSSNDFIKYLDIIVSKDNEIDKIDFSHLAKKIKNIIKEATRMYESRYFNVSSISLLENTVSDFETNIIKKLFI